MSPEPVDQAAQNRIENGTTDENVPPPDSASQKADGKNFTEAPDGIKKKISSGILPITQVTPVTSSRTRHIVLIIGTLCMTMLLSNILILNVTIICMTGGAKEKDFILYQLSNSSADEMMEIRDSDADGQRDPPDFDPTPGKRSLVFASGAVGALTFIPAAVTLLRRIGARKTFAIAGMLSASATVLTPLAVRGGLASFALARLIQGASLSSLFPVIGGVSAGWSTLKYGGLFLSVITSFVQLAPIFTFPVAGSLCVTEAGWPMAYYVHAMITVFFFTLWAVFFKDTPHGHRWITDVEIKKIMEGKPPMPSSPRPVPFRAILSSPTIWVIWLTALANFAGMQLFIIYMANFISNYLGYSLRDSCLLAALPPLVQFFTKIIAGILGDRQYSFLSATSKVRVFNSVASIGSGAFLLGLVFVPPTQRFWSIVLLMLSASFLGFNTSGLFRSPSLVARQHTHFVMTIVQVLLCVCLLGMPFVVELLTSLKSPRDWSLVFGAVAFFLIITNVLYCIFAKGSPASWTVIKEQSPAKIHPTNDTLPPSTIVTVTDSNTLTN